LAHTTSAFISLSPFLAVFSAHAAFYFFVRHNASRSNILIRSLHHFLKGGIGFDLIEAGLHISESQESFANDPAAVAAAVLCEVIENLFAPFIEDKLEPAKAQSSTANEAVQH
jgi:hypothetical protein